MHRIDLRPGTALFVACPSCKKENRISGSQWTRVVMAFNSPSQSISSTCPACKAALSWSPSTAKVGQL
ncbi:MAG: hypothetical protein JOZ10_08225 [Acidobacteria bacterium]|nr:hypothetical protein [Acidobacteriota bacterium]MBV9145306.1 hypothetical protein [Acidobacteriota bacterium]MBV9435079.1 hypothetical protein [Acidobacteriota bacterium]